MSAPSNTMEPDVDVDQAQQRAPERGLARAALADDADRLAAADAEIDAAQDLDAAARLAPNDAAGRRRRLRVARDEEIVSHARGLHARRRRAISARSAAITSGDGLEARRPAGRSADRRRAARACRRGAARSSTSAVGALLDRPRRRTAGDAVADLRDDAEIVGDEDAPRAVRAPACARMSRRICFCTVTSSAVVGSSATIELAARARRRRRSARAGACRPRVRADSRAARARGRGYAPRRAARARASRASVVRSPRTSRRPSVSLRLDAPAGVERGHRVLRDQRDVARRSIRASRRAACVEQVAALEQRFRPPVTRTVRGQDAEDRLGDGRFAGAAFADQAARLRRADGRARRRAGSARAVASRRPR